MPLGSAELQPPQPGEVIYRDDVGVICRAWNWREAERTKLTSQTTDAVLFIEAVPPITDTVLDAACEELASLVTVHLGGTAERHVVAKDVPKLEVS